MLKWVKRQILNKGAKKGHKYKTFGGRKVGEFSTSIRKSIKYKPMSQPLQTLYLIGVK